MRHLGRIFGLVFGIGAALAALSAEAQGSPDSPSAALAFPIITDDAAGIVTFTTVSNTTSELLVLYVVALDGDTWRAIDYTCALGSEQSTFFSFQPTPSEILVTFECTNPATGEKVFFSDDLPMRRGVFFVALADPPTGQTTNTNAIIGDATVLNFGQGSAYSVEAIAFEGLDPTAPGVGDRVFRFDGVEYSEPPATLDASFLAPTIGSIGTDIIDADLILFTFDGTAGIEPGPGVALDIVFQGDDGQPRNAQWSFDCFDVVDLLDIDPRFERGLLGSDAGHLTITPRDAVQTHFGHDATFDGGAGLDGLRRAPVFGWLVQTITPFIQPEPTQQAFGRVLAPSDLALAPRAGDVPVFNVFGGLVAVPADARIRLAIQLYGRSVALTTLEGTGSRPRVRRARLRLFELELELAQRFIDRGLDRPACVLLYLAMVGSDGESRPRDLVQGPGASELNQIVTDVREVLGCGGG